MFRSYARFAVGAAVAASVFSCSSSGGGSKPPVRGSTNLIAVEYGRLIDVYGMRATPVGPVIALFARDVIAGPDIRDERDIGSALRDDEVLFDYLTANPDTLQPRLLITREIGSEEFQKAFASLDDSLRSLTPARIGDPSRSAAHSVVPRNAALRLTFNRDLGVALDFFVELDENGAVVGPKNTVAVQLLHVVGDPNGNDVRTAFEPISTRQIARGSQLILDPVLLGTEGTLYRVKNNATGMPEAPDRASANIRLAIALEGELALPALRARPDEPVGSNAEGARSVVRDFRSGHRDDDTPDSSRGFIRDPVPPRLVGQLPMYLAKVEPRDQFSQVATIFKGATIHEIDRGDALRFVVDNSGEPVGTSEVVAEPADDAGEPQVDFVRVVITRIAGLEQIDPSSRPDYPTEQAALRTWLPANAPRAVLLAEFTARRLHPKTGKPYGDDPHNFVRFTPDPLPLASGGASPNNQNVSPFASAVVRFSKPIDMRTAKPFDTLFFAMRDVLSEGAIRDFIEQHRIDPRTFVAAKFVTPHLIGARRFDEDGSQTTLRLTPEVGFYLDEVMRATDRGKPFAEKKYRYWLHVVAGTGGILDLAGNPLDLGVEVDAVDALTLPFSLDTRKTLAGMPVFPDNIAVSVVRRLDHADEDEQPSYYRPDEVQRSGASFNHRAFNLEDIFGGVLLQDGRLSARPPSRVRRMVDNLNQVPPPPQSSPQRYCPFTINRQEQTVNGTAARRFGQPIQNPLNPFGARLQMLWREVDWSLSRTDPNDFDLDVEQLYWAPFSGNPITFDEFDRTSLFLGHSEYRPEPCVGVFSALPSLPQSGLKTAFSDNYVHNNDVRGQALAGPKPHTAYLDRPVTILSGQAIFEPNQVYRYLPLPEFQKPYFVWRDQRVAEQGGDAGAGFDTGVLRNGNFASAILSPFLTGRGRYVTAGPAFNLGAWNSRRNWQLTNTNILDPATGGLVGSIALPLLGDFWVYPDSPDLPVEQPFRASGANGWQVSIAVGSSFQPAFRAYSGGGLVAGQPRLVEPNNERTAEGGFTPQGQRTRPADNTVYWTMADFGKRVTVATAGFVDIHDPHRVADRQDPRLGPYPRATLPRFQHHVTPERGEQPGGTSVVVEFRGAGAVDPQPWEATQNGYTPAPNAVNFPLDPRKACDAHIRKMDDRGGRGWWTYPYNRTVTGYTADPNEVVDRAFTSRFAGGNDTFEPADVRYFNWRFVMTNNPDTGGTPDVDAFSISYRLEPLR